MGGKQSFAVAVLDNRNTGFIISSLFINEGNKVFVKSVKNVVYEPPVEEVQEIQEVQEVEEVEEVQEVKKVKPITAIKKKLTK